MKALLAALLLLPVPAIAQATGQTTAQAPAEPSKLVFHFEHAGMVVPVYTFTLLDSGEGTFTRDAAAPVLALHLPQTTYARLFAQVREPNAFRGCNSRARNLANTGIKTLAYTGVGAPLTCTFNYSDSKTVTALATEFEGMEETLEAGERLERLHRFDRLGLDAEMQALVLAAKEGRAAGLANIAAVLKSLVDDPQVLERVRMGATRLLEQGAAGK